MTLPNIFSTAAFAPIACLALWLSGCATVAPQADHSSTTATSSLRSLRLSDTEVAANTAPDAGMASTPTPTKSPSKRPPAQTTTSSGLADKSLPIVEIPTQPPLPKAIDLTDNCDDLFQRIRNGFSMPDINNDLVLYHQQWYMNRPDYVRRMVERSSLYLYHIVNELDKRGMPMELALLPMVESAYNPMAYSRSKASGLWQFIPATGKRYNLDQNWWKDERRDIVASTAAALDYLQSIYEMHGDWQLALASYNWGEGAVGRAIGKNRAQGLPTDYQSLTMPGETKNYVPKLQALKNIFRNPALMAELSLSAIPNRPYFGTVTKTANIDVKVAAKLAEMPVQEFVALNPAHNRPVIKSDTPLVIPADKVDTFINNVEAHENSNKPLSNWQTYTMRPGDKLEKIAPRFGMTVANLKEANGIKGRIKISPGFTLLVAGQSGGESLNMDALPEQPRLPDADPVPASDTKHTVRKGETLPTIAKHYGTSIAELKRINHLKGDKIAAGQRLAIFITTKTPASSKGEKASAQPTQLARQDKKSPKVIHYTVRRGDTLTSIARQFKVDKDDLQRWNRATASVLRPGKTLTIQLAQNP